MNKQTERLYAVDALRGLAILFSLNQHLGIWFFRSGFKNQPVFYYINAIGGFAGPLFLTLAGISSVLFLEKYKNSASTLVFRGVLLICFGYLLNLLVPSWFSYASWFTLHMIGFGMVFAPLFRKTSVPVILSLSVFILFVAILFQNGLETPMRLWNERMGRSDLPGGIFRLILVEGHFPIFPWLAFFLGGMAVGKLFLSGQSKKLGAIVIGCYLVSGVILLCYFLKPDFVTHGPLVRFFRIYLGFYPVTPVFFFLLFPLVILYLFLFQKIDRIVRFTSFSSLVCLGRASLTIFFIHIIIFKELAIRFGYFQLFSPVAATVAIMTVMAVFTFLSVAWRKIQFRFGLEWLLRQVPLKD